jgi:hypothetical protein
MKYFRLIVTAALTSVALGCGIYEDLNAAKAEAEKARAELKNEQNAIKMIYEED